MSVATCLSSYNLILEQFLVTSDKLQWTQFFHNDFTPYTCMDFITMVTSFCGYGKWVHYKHLYYILNM